MPKLSPTTIPAAFSLIREVANTLKETNDCAVIALALTTGNSYEVAHAALKEAGREDGKPTPNEAVLTALAALGYDTEPVAIRPIINEYPGVHVNLKSATTHHPRRFKSAWDAAFDGAPALLFSKEHVSAYTGGLVLDYAINKSNRLLSVLKLIPREPVATETETDTAPVVETENENDTAPEVLEILGIPRKRAARGKK